MQHVGMSFRVGCFSLFFFFFLCCPMFIFPNNDGQRIESLVSSGIPALPLYIPGIKVRFPVPPPTLHSPTAYETASLLPTDHTGGGIGDVRNTP